MSSMSEDFMRVLQEQHAEYQGMWNKKVRVPMLTLDTLIENYGMPNYVKIDVEGFEEHVLDGLSSQPPLLSFEFNLAYLDAAFRCLDKLVFSPTSAFNFVFGENAKFEFTEWIGQKDELKRHLGKMKTIDTNGDVFVRKGV